MKAKRINYAAKDEQMFRGPHAGVYMTGIEVHVRGLDSKDPMASKPTVMLWPVDRKSKSWDDRGLNIPMASLDEFIQALLLIQETVGT